MTTWEPNAATTTMANVNVYRMSLVTDVTVVIMTTTVLIPVMDVKAVIVQRPRIAHNVTGIVVNVHANLVSPENYAIDACQGIGTMAKMDVIVSVA